MNVGHAHKSLALGQYSNSYGLFWASGKYGGRASTIEAIRNFPFTKPTVYLIHFILFRISSRHCCQEQNLEAVAGCNSTLAVSEAAHWKMEDAFSRSISEVCIALSLTLSSFRFLVSDFESNSTIRLHNTIDSEHWKEITQFYSNCGLRPI